MSTEFRKELEGLINRHSKEQGSNTPDFILAQFLDEQLQLFDNVLQLRASWYGEDAFKQEALCNTPPKEAGE